jgi:uncharacterized membrane protein
MDWMERIWKGAVMAGIGPLEFLVVAFPGEELPDRVAAVMRAVEVGGDVRIMDALVVVKAFDGRVSDHELAEIDTLAGVAAEYGLADLGTSLIDAADVDEIGQVLGSGTVALALLIEHTWARETAAAVGDLGGRLVAAVRIPDGYADEALGRRRAALGPGVR